MPTQFGTITRKALEFLNRKDPDVTPIDLDDVAGLQLAEQTAHRLNGQGQIIRDVQARQSMVRAALEDEEEPEILAARN